MQAALTTAAAIPALIALGYSFAYEIVHEPSAFLPIRQPVGALGLSNFFNDSVNSLPIVTYIRLVVSLWHHQICSAGSGVPGHLVAPAISGPAR